MRIVLDANVLIAGLAIRGICRSVVRHCLTRHEVVVSKSILEETREKLIIKLNVPPDLVNRLLDLVQTRAHQVHPARVDPSECRDPDDLLVLGTALSGSCNCLITGDKDLLILKNFHGIAIVNPRDFWQSEQTRQP